MKTFLVQRTVYTFAEIQANNWEEAEAVAGTMKAKDFDEVGDTEVEVIDEITNDEPIICKICGQFLEQCGNWHIGG
jgi:hypothetical protein